MALDSKQKRGSAISLSLPHRQWLQEPDGTIAASDRLSLVKLCSAIAAAAVVRTRALCYTRTRALLTLGFSDTNNQTTLIATSSNETTLQGTPTLGCPGD